MIVFYYTGLVFYILKGGRDESYPHLCALMATSYFHSVFFCPVEIPVQSKYSALGWIRGFGA